MKNGQLDGKNIFLTGGTGFFGKSILDMLRKGYLPKCFFTILSRDPEAFLRKNPEFSGADRVRFVKGDVRDFSFPQEKFDYIIHAATPAVTTLPPGKMRSIILEGTARTLAFAGQCGAARLLFASSGAVYGPLPPECEKVSEKYPCAPVTEYGIAKLEAEEMCLASGVRTVIARCFAFVGPYLELDIHFAIGNFLRNCLNGEEVVIKGDGTPLRSYMFADDLVEWLFTLLLRGRSGEAYNVGSPDEISIAELAREVTAHFPSALPVRIMQKPLPGSRREHYVPDVSKAQTELGLRLKVSLDEAIERCKKFHLERMASGMTAGKK